MDNVVNIVVTVIIFVLFVCWFTMTIGNEIRNALEKFAFKRIHNIWLKRCRIGSEGFNISSFEIRNEKYLQDFIEDETLRQIQQVQEMVNEIVGLIIGYDLKWFEADWSRARIQDEVDGFVINLERFNKFLKQPDVAVEVNFSEATKELTEANQPILNNLEVIRKDIIDYIEEGGYPLIEFGS